MPVLCVDDGSRILDFLVRHRELSHPQTARIWGFAQLNLAEAFAARRVEEDAVFVAGPNGIVFEKSRAFHVNEEAARFTAADDDAVGEGRLFRVEIVLFAKDMVNVFEKLFNGRQTMNLIHRRRIQGESRSKDGG